MSLLQDNGQKLFGWNKFSGNIWSCVRIAITCLWPESIPGISIEKVHKFFHKTKIPNLMKPRKKKTLFLKVVQNFNIKFCSKQRIDKNILYIWPPQQISYTSFFFSKKCFRYHSCNQTTDTITINDRKLKLAILELIFLFRSCISWSLHIPVSKSIASNHMQAIEL